MCVNHFGYMNRAPSMKHQQVPLTKHLRYSFYNLKNPFSSNIQVRIVIRTEFKLYIMQNTEC